MKNSTRTTLLVQSENSFSALPIKEWVMYCVTPIISSNNLYGALVLSVPIEHVVAQIELIKWQILWISVATGIGAIMLITLFSGTMLKAHTAAYRRHIENSVGRLHPKSESAGPLRNGPSWPKPSTKCPSASKTWIIQETNLWRTLHTSLKTPMSTIKILVETLQHQKVIRPRDHKRAFGRRFKRDRQNEPFGGRPAFTCSS